MTNLPSSFPDVRLHTVDAPSWRRPGIHTPDRGYGFRVRDFVAPLRSAIFTDRDQLLMSEDQVFSISLTTDSGIGM
jgi:hypothetical protein